ncbi:MAG TPA: metallophosphoesterase [Pirellulaceae bacterium]|nr:metallophosphoesterase [Pirellulaceae bacterium]
MVASSQDVEQIIAIYHQAAECNRATPARQGNVVVLDHEVADEVMITADLHGHRFNFNKLLKLADLEQQPRRHLIMQEVCHGGPTYPGGGCMSHIMLEDVARLKVRFPNQFHFLMSNHELAELTDYPITKNRRVLNLTFRCGLHEMYGNQAEQVREACLEFLGSLPLAARCGQTFICHSLPERVDEVGFDSSVFQRPLEPADLACDGAAFQLVWGRDFRPANADAFARLVHAEMLIHGHEPCPNGYNVPNPRQLILDCCTDRACYLTLRPGEKLSQKELVGRIQRLGEIT